jgi:hypothetical protein
MIASLSTKNTWHVMHSSSYSTTLFTSNSEGIALHATETLWGYKLYDPFIMKDLQYKVPLSRKLKGMLSSTSNVFWHPGGIVDTTTLIDLAFIWTWKLFCHVSVSTYIILLVRGTQDEFVVSAISELTSNPTLCLKHKRFL